MKNLKFIKKMVKASGLTGAEFQNEYQEQVLSFAKFLLAEIIVGTDMQNLTWRDCVSHLSHLSEIYVEARREQFDTDFAEKMQTLVFDLSPNHTSAFCQWYDETFRTETPNTESEQETGAAASEGETSRDEKPDHLEIENTALLISDVLNNPNVPKTIRDSLADGVEEMYNTKIDQPEINAFWKSPEYIAMVLRGFDKAEANDEQN